MASNNPQFGLPPVRCCGKRIAPLTTAAVSSVNVFSPMRLCSSWSRFTSIRAKFEKEFPRSLSTTRISSSLDGPEEAFSGFGILSNTCTISGSHKSELKAKLECMVPSNLVTFSLVLCFRRAESRSRSHCFLAMDESTMGMASVSSSLPSTTMSSR